MRNIKFSKLYLSESAIFSTGYVFTDVVHYQKAYRIGLLFDLDKLYCYGSTQQFYERYEDYE